MADKFKIYTKSGDQGETSLCNGSRTSKGSHRVEAYGAVDELNTFLGLAVVKTREEDLKKHIMSIQRDLHAIGANLAYPEDLSQSTINGSKIADMIPPVRQEDILKIEQWIDSYEEELPFLNHFILAGGTESSAYLHVARTVCRRAEREIVRLREHEEIDKHVLKYMNRLSDYLFTAARLASHREGKDDIKWMPKQSDLDEYTGPQTKLDF
ncbi:cob(I)yrinic acid a,c-diamide adenosyltransferase [Candidatus Woesearchaeota archaeon]|nr:cob(I)yrinic acid a,c-diamide adenosyltransferase [Candidatus Woesearchaeota archaeon]